MNSRVVLPAAKTSAIEDAERSISLLVDGGVDSSFLGTVRTGIREVTGDYEQSTYLLLPATP